jgi:AcrR family transcriptional regulator
MKKKESEARERILGAATDLIRERGGAEDLTVRDVAARADVGVGLANYHFQTKENLVGLCVRRAEEPFLGSLPGAGSGEEPLTRLRAAAGEYMRFLAGDPGIARASLLGALASPSPDDGAARAMEAFMPAVREACAGRATETEARALCHMLLSSLREAFLRGGAFAEYAGLDARDRESGRQLAGVFIYILFHKYL